MKQNKNTGFTILEILVTLGILSIILMSATTLLTSNIKAVQAVDKNVEHTQNLRIATNQILDRIKKDNAVKVQYEAGVLIINDKPLLDTTIKTTNSNSSQLWLYPNGNTAELRDATGNNQVLAEYIEYITIDDEPNGKPYLNIKIKVAEIEEAVLSIPKTFAFSSEIPDSPDDPNAFWGKYITFSHRLEIQDATINGPDVYVYVANRNGSTLQIHNSTTKIKTARVYVEKHLVIHDAVLGKDDGSSIFYVDGNVTFVNQAKIIGKVYYTGNVNHDKEDDNLHKVDSIDFPEISMPDPKPEAWFAENGFTADPTPRNNMKYSGNDYILLDNVTAGNVCIYTSYTGNAIELRNHATNVSGILYAPYGTVLIRSGATFSGLIVADEIIIENSNTTVNFQSFDTSDLPFQIQD
ncbi:MAG TPA: type II secretion system protein [Peptococcaceae bacterium]|nr:type II secretion system protein [Peptococcaceae bacterium]